MAAQKRVDNKRRILKEGESQLPDGRYRYRSVSYTHLTLPTNSLV